MWFICCYIYCCICLICCCICSICCYDAAGYCWICFICFCSCYICFVAAVYVSVAAISVSYADVYVAERKYRTDGKVFNLRRLKAKTKVKVATLRELLFADDCARNSSNTEAEMHQCVNHFSRACDNFRFTISTKKTEVMHQAAPRKMYHKPHISVNDEPLKAADSFTYLGSSLSREANIDVEVNNRLSKANSAFGILRKKVWDRRWFSQETKLKVYVDVVLTVLLHACESWTVHSRHARKLNHFQTKCLRIILNIKWHDMVPDTEVPLTRAGIPSIHTVLQKAQVRWAGHVTRMPDDRLPKQISYGELCYGKRSLGGQKKRFKDTLKKTLISFNIDVTNWEVCAQDRPPVAQNDSYRSKNSRNKQDLGGSEKALCSQSETLLYHQHLSRPDIPMPQVWNTAAGQIWNY